MNILKIKIYNPNSNDINSINFYPINVSFNNDTALEVNEKMDLESNDIARIVKVLINSLIYRILYNFFMKDIDFTIFCITISSITQHLSLNLVENIIIIHLNNLFEKNISSDFKLILMVDEIAKTDKKDYYLHVLKKLVDNKPIEKLKIQEELENPKNQEEIKKIKDQEELENSKNQEEINKLKVAEAGPFTSPEDADKDCILL